MNQTQEQKARCVAVFGTGSDVGKSIITTALCRIFSNRGVRVCPYKAQNMSNNSGVTHEGLEMGRAQIVQAESARLAPHVDMNPVLLKPVSQVGSQVVLLGKVLQDFSASQYHKEKARLFSTACESIDRLKEAYDVVVMEGAGSCAEVNLMARDIVNLRMAAYAQAPVILVADIDRGGVFAQIVGTLECLEKEQQDQIAGFIINRFRGDISLFSDGVKWIEERTGKKVFGVLPWFDHFHIQSEDSVVIEHPEAQCDPDQTPTVAVIRIPHISNFTDFDPLFQVEGLGVNFLERVCDLSPYKAVILPGSKSTRNDLDWLEQMGWTQRIQDYVRNGGHVLGICGGYQMLGKEVHDAQGLEGAPGITKGLGLLPHETTLKAPKTTTLTRFAWDGLEGSGYEIHMGQTQQTGKELFQVLERNQESIQDNDGGISDDGRVLGTYIHGLFDTPAILRKWLEGLGLGDLEVPKESAAEARDRQYDMLAEHFKKHVDVDALIKELLS